MTAAPAASASSLLVPRGGNSSCLGLVLALIALLAQIAGPGLHPPALIGSVNGAGKLAIALGAHALCLAPDSTTPERPTPVIDLAPQLHCPLYIVCGEEDQNPSVVQAEELLARPRCCSLNATRRL